MKLTKLATALRSKGMTPESLALRSKGDFSNMTVRRAIKGEEIDQLKAKAIARVLRCKTEDLI